MASLTQWTWVWVYSGSWWWTGRTGLVQFMGWQRVGHDWVTELNWTELSILIHLSNDILDIIFGKDLNWILLIFKNVFLFLKFYFIFKLYNIVSVLPNIKMNPPQVYMFSPSWTLLPPASPYHPSGSSQCTSSPKHPVSCIEPGLATHFILYMFQCHSLKSSHPLPLPQSPKDFCTSMSLLLSRRQGYCYHLSKFHIYALVYCIGVFPSGLLHSV